MHVFVTYINNTALLISFYFYLFSLSTEHLISLLFLHALEFSTGASTNFQSVFSAKDTQIASKLSWQTALQSTSSQEFLHDWKLNSWSTEDVSVCLSAVRMASLVYIPISSTEEFLWPTLCPHLMLCGLPILVSLKDVSWSFYTTHL